LAPIAAALVLHVEHLASYIKAYVTNRPVPPTINPVSENRRFSLATGFILMILVTASFMLLLIVDRETQNRDSALEARIAKLEGVIGIESEKLKVK
jgi:hypothetical protein